jgi:DNA-directed RNA polymerase specialized sigma24 family protein
MPGRSFIQESSLSVRKTASRLEQPGAFQLAILRALKLPRHHRDVFFLKDIQGHSLIEIVAILGITPETARIRIRRARRAIGQLGDSVATGRVQ